MGQTLKKLSPTERIRVFVSYANASETAKRTLLGKLWDRSLTQVTTVFDDRMLTVGRPDGWEQELLMEFRSARMILLLITEEFLASRYCMSVEVPLAISMAQQASAHVIVVHLDRAGVGHPAFESLIQWPSAATSLLDVAKGDDALGELQKTIKRKVVEDFKVGGHFLLLGDTVQGRLDELHANCGEARSIHDATGMAVVSGLVSGAVSGYGVAILYSNLSSWLTLFSALLWVHVPLLTVAFFVTKSAVRSEWGKYANDRLPTFILMGYVMLILPCVLISVVLAVIAGWVPLTPVRFALVVAGYAALGTFCCVQVRCSSQRLAIFHDVGCE